MLVSTSSDLPVTRKRSFRYPHVFFVVFFCPKISQIFSLKPLDIEIMKRLGTRVNLIPVIAKADTLTQNDLLKFKQRVRICSECHRIM